MEPFNKNYVLDKSSQISFGCVGKLNNVKEKNKYKILNVEDVNILECDNKKVLDFESMINDVKEKILNIVVNFLLKEKEFKIKRDELKKKIVIFLPKEKNMERMNFWRWDNFNNDNLENYIFDFIKFKYTIKNINVSKKNDEDIIKVYVRNVITTGIKKINDIKGSNEINDF